MSEEETAQFHIIAGYALCSLCYGFILFYYIFLNFLLFVILDCISLHPFFKLYFLHFFLLISLLISNL